MYPPCTISKAVRHILMTQASNAALVCEEPTCFSLPSMTEPENPINEKSRDYEIALLRPLSKQIPSIDAAIAEIVRFSAELTLPKGTIHVISDIHGEDKKLRHVINNASGTLRPLVEKLFKTRYSKKEFQELL